MELLCSLPLGDKEEERHQRGGAADQQAEGDAAGPVGQGGADPEAAAGGEWLLQPYVCVSVLDGQGMLLAALEQGPADLLPGATLFCSWMVSWRPR